MVLHVPRSSLQVGITIESGNCEYDPLSRQDFMNMGEEGLKCIGKSSCSNAIFAFLYYTKKKIRCPPEKGLSFTLIEVKK